MKDKINLGEIESVYMIGIKGSGMIAFVEIFHNLGKSVFGSDVEERFFTDKTLEKLEIEYEKGFGVENIKKNRGVDLVIYSTAYNEGNNPEVKYAKEQGMKMLSYPELIGLFSEEKRTIAVCGTHGKTTTSAMLALTLKSCNVNPTAIIGSKVKQLDASTVVGDSDVLVVEADEYQNKLSNYKPFGVVLLNVEYDHPDFFKSEDDYKQVFIDFIKKIPKEGFLVVCGEEEWAVEVAKDANCKVVVYGFFEREGQIQRVGELLDSAGVKEFEFFVVPGDLDLKVAGRHNKLNATAALAASTQLEVECDEAQKIVQQYEGVSRRFEQIGTFGDVIVIDDYAHHPTEIRATLAAAKEKFSKRRIVCVFHPHTFSRTKELLADFAKSFELADEVIVLDIYGSAREEQGGVSSDELVELASKTHKNIKHIPTIDEVFEYLKENLSGDEVVLTVGAGDVDKLARMLVGKN